MTGSSGRVERWLTPTVPDLVFGLVLASVLIGGRHRLLNDPGTPWHLRLGREIASARAVPRADALTFTRVGVAWVDQSWLFDLGLAGLVDVGGWSAAAGAAALGLAWLYAGVARSLLRDGRTPLVALVVAVVAAGVGAIHFLIRPHLFTLAGVFLVLRLCQRQHERGGWGVFWAVPLTAVWANLHGGFLAAPVVVATAGLGHAASGPLDRARRREALTFAAVVPLCLAAALCNPYGPGLYRHVAGLLVGSGVTELIEEYQPIPFGKPDARVVEWVILALVALPVFTSRAMTRYELAHALVWLHLSLASVRHAPLFALAVAPGLARLLDGLFTSPAPREPTSPSADRSAWPWVAAAGVGLALAAGARLTEFDPRHWPLSALPSLNALPPKTRAFHEQDWGGLIAAEADPPRPVLIDDRFELFGKAGILLYLNTLAGGPDWDAVRDREGIGAVWVRPDRPLARRLETERGWRVVFRDGVSVLFEQTPEAQAPRPVPGLAARGAGWTAGAKGGFDFPEASHNLEGSADRLDD